MCHAHAPADKTPLPPGEGKPILQLEAGGPTAAVTALLFSADGKTLYAAGLDKVVRVWEQKLVANKPVWTLERSFHVPIGPGVSGAINALALSGDGRGWLSAAVRSCAVSPISSIPAWSCRSRLCRSQCGARRRQYLRLRSEKSRRRQGVARPSRRSVRWRWRRIGPASRRCWYRRLTNTSVANRSAAVCVCGMPKKAAKCWP